MVIYVGCPERGTGQRKRPSIEIKEDTAGIKVKRA